MVHREPRRKSSKSAPYEAMGSHRCGLEHSVFDRGVVEAWTGYLPKFRRRIEELHECGRKVSEIAEEFEAGERTIYALRRRARVDM